MRIETTRFGAIEVGPEQVMHFEDGLPGYESLRDFAFLVIEESEPFHWLQAVGDPDVSLAVIDPFELFSDYAPSVDDKVLEALGVEKPEDVLLLAVCVIPPDVRQATVNLLAPVLLNLKKNVGRQVIVDNPAYLTRQPLFDAVRAALKGGGADAGFDA